MHSLDALLPDGVAARADVADAASRSSVTRWGARGDLVQLHPGVLALPRRAPEFVVRARAALLWAGGGVLSHGSSLVAHGLVAKDLGPVHVTTGPEQRLDGGAGVVVHRATGRLPLAAVGGFLVTALASSLVEAWAWGSAPAWNARAGRDLPAARHALVAAVRDRRVEIERVRRASAQRPRHPGAGPLRLLLDLLEQGCQSEWEVFGVLHVLRVPGLPPPELQHRVRLPDGRRVFLDATWRAAGVAVELDGLRFHSSRADRERDMRRDTALAVLGWVVLRFSYERLT